LSTDKPKTSLEVVLIDSDGRARSTMKSYLSAQGANVTAMANDLSSGSHHVRAMRHGIVVLELPKNTADTLEAIRRIRTDQPQIGIILTARELTPDLILRSLRAGAQEFLARPVEIRELGEAISRLRTLQAPVRTTQESTGKIVTVFSCKGGCGVSSVAVNLAAALQKRDAKVALVDLDLQMGDLALMLDLRPAHTLAEIPRGGTLDDAKLRNIIAPHGSGLSLLASPERIDDADGITPGHVAEVLSLLQSRHDYVVVDAGRSFDPRPLEALSMADLVLMVTSASVPSIRNTKLGIALLGELGLDKERIRLVLNGYHKSSGVKPKDVDEAIGMAVSWTLPADPRAMQHAVDAGAPVALNAPRSELGRGFATLAGELASLVDATATPKGNKAAA